MGGTVAKSSNLHVHAMAQMHTTTEVSSKKLHGVIHTGDIHSCQISSPI